MLKILFVFTDNDFIELVSSFARILIPHTNIAIGNAYWNVSIEKGNIENPNRIFKNLIPLKLKIPKNEWNFNL